MNANPKRESHSTNGIENVIFDVGGVLLNWNPDVLLAGLYADTASREQIKREVLGHVDWLDMDRGKLDEAECVERFSHRTGRSRAEMSAFMDAVRVFLTPIDGTHALLAELAHSRRVKLYCLSNMAEAVFIHLRGRYNFWERFDGVVISAHVGMIKPAREIYEHLIARYGLKPEASVFVDDMSANVEAARAVGLRAIHFRGADECRRELSEIHGLHDALARS